MSGLACASALFFIFKYVRTSVKIWYERKRHVATLRREELRLKTFQRLYYENKKINTNFENISFSVTNQKEFSKIMKQYANPYENVLKVLENLRTFLETSDEPPKILGVGMTKTTLISFVAYTVTITGFVLGFL